MIILEERSAVVKEAFTWDGTPYHHGAHVKKAGCSCAWFIAAVYNEALKMNLTVIDYPEQWYMADFYVKNKKELYLEELERQGFIPIKKEEVQSADLAVSKTNNQLYCHAGIIVKWPQVIHVAGGRGCQLAKNLYASWYFAQRPDSLLFYSRKEWHG